MGDLRRRKKVNKFIHSAIAIFIAQFMKVLISVEISNREAEKAPRRYISRFFQVIGNIFSVNVLSMSRHNFSTY